MQAKEEKEGREEEGGPAAAPTAGAALLQRPQAGLLEDEAEEPQVRAQDGMQV